MVVCVGCDRWCLCSNVRPKSTSIYHHRGRHSSFIGLMMPCRKGLVMSAVNIGIEPRLWDSPLSRNLEMLTTSDCQRQDLAILWKAKGSMHPTQIPPQIPFAVGIEVRPKRPELAVRKHVSEPEHNSRFLFGFQVSAVTTDDGLRLVFAWAVSWRSWSGSLRKTCASIDHVVGWIGLRIHTALHGGSTPDISSRKIDIISVSRATRKLFIASQDSTRHSNLIDSNSSSNDTTRSREDEVRWGRSCR